MAIPDEQIESVKEILTRWNPLGDEAEAVGDLDNYRTEAIDILAELAMSRPGVRAQVIVQTVLNQAFNLSLTVDDCRQAADEINGLRG